MKPKLVLIGNLLLLVLIILVIIEKVYSHSFSANKQLIIAYSEIFLILILILFHGFSIFYKYIRKS